MTNGADQPQEQTSPAGQPDNETCTTPVETGPFFQLQDWLSFGLTAVVALVVYLRTLAPEVTLHFSGILSTSAMYGGVAYQPGFPVWNIYSWFFVRLLPFGNVAWRVAVGSALAAALACGLVALMVSQAGVMFLETKTSLTRRAPTEQNLLRVICGFVGGMALGLSSIVWRIAVVAEIWALSVLLFSITLCLFTRWMSRPEQRRFLFEAFFVFGLVLTGNQELIVLTPGLLLLVLLGDQELGRDLSLAVLLLVVADWLFAWFRSYILFSPYLKGNPGLLVAFSLVGVAAVVAMVQTRCFGSHWKPAILCGAALLLGLACYVYLPIVSMANPPINWGYPRTVEGFFHVITRGQYDLPHPTDEVGRFLGQLWFVGKETWNWFGWQYLIFAAVPFFFLRRISGHLRNWLLGLAAVFTCAGPLMVALLNPPAELAYAQYVAPWFVPAYTIVALWTGLGLMMLGSLAAKARMSSRTDEERRLA